MGLHKPIAYLNRLLRQDLIIVDGLSGDLDFEEGGNPVPMNRIFAGKDPVLADAYGAHLMGFDIGEIPYISMAEDIGAGTADLTSAEIIELNKDSGTKKLAPSGKVRRLAAHIVEDGACSACYGSLVHALQRLHEKGLLDKLQEKLHIGQGFKNKRLSGIGIGSCAAGFGRCVKGCPPKAKEIVEYLEGVLQKS